MYSVTNYGDTRCFKDFDEAWDFAVDQLHESLDLVDLIKVRGSAPGDQRTYLFDPDVKSEREEARAEVEKLEPSHA